MHKNKRKKIECQNSKVCANKLTIKYKATAI